MQQAMNVVNRSARIATVSIGQTTGLRVLAMLDMNLLILSFFISLLDSSGETQRTRQKAMSVVHL